jgi:hypothetical protein
MNSDLAQTSHSQSQKEAWEKLLGIPVAPVALQPAPDRRPRRLTAEACKIDNLLSHAIEYLTDDRKIPSGKITELSPIHPDVQAILALMEARHRVYLDFPVIERRSVFNLLGAFKGPERRRR